MLRDRINKKKLDKSLLMENTYTNVDNLCHIKSVFFSGDFTSFLIQLLGSSEQYLIDSVHISFILNSLGLLKTRFSLAKLLYNSETRNIVRDNVVDLAMEYSTKCIDL